MPRAKASLLVILTSALTVAVLFLLPYTPAQRVRTVVAGRGDLMRTVLLSGTVSYLNRQPCVNAQAGRVAGVYVQPGQAVREGDLLFAMDTSAQEAALASVQKARYAQRLALEGQGDAVAALTMERELAWQEQENALRQSIEAAGVRAGMDGVVEAVYVGEGDWLDTASVLGAVRDEGKCVVAMAKCTALPQAQTGMPAVLGEKDPGPARLSRLGAPDAQSGTQRLVFTPAAQEQLANCEIGETVTVEMLVETVRNRVLVPLSAVAADGRVWYVENGRAHSEVPDDVRRGGEMVALGEEWEGRRIVLLPDGVRLTEGCTVKEAKAE